MIRQVTKYLITKIKAQLVVLAGRGQAQESKIKLIHLHVEDYHFGNDKKLIVGVFLPHWERWTTKEVTSCKRKKNGDAGPNLGWVLDAFWVRFKSVSRKYLCYFVYQWCVS